MSDAVMERVLASFAPITLPSQAWGPSPIEWFKPAERPPVWVWVSWPHSSATHLPGFVVGANDRVCIVEVRTDIWSRWEPVVWRNAVTHREPGEGEPPS